MAVATVVTNIGKAMLADRLRTTPGTYSASPRYVGMGVGAGSRTAAVGDTALTTPAESRVLGTESTVTTSVANDTYQVVGTITATATRAVDEMGLFDAAAAGNMGFSATHAIINLATNDAIQYTAKIQVT